MSTLKTDVSQLKAAQEEDHLNLKALEHKAETNKAGMIKCLQYFADTWILKRVKTQTIKEVIGRHEIDITV